MKRGVRRALVTGVVVAALASTVGAPAAPEAWRIVKRGSTAGAGQVATVGTLVRRPSGVAVRVVVSKPRLITVTVIVSCRRGLKTGVGRGRFTDGAPYTKALRLPLTGADNCAVSAMGTNPTGTLRLDLYRGA
jgi:hypothetical protein